jgi:hypothetical protein
MSALSIIGPLLSGVGTGLSSIFRIFTSVFTIFGTSFLAIFSVGLYILEPLTRDLGKEKFNLTPKPPQSTSIVEDILFMLLELIYAIKDVFMNIITTLTTMFPFLIILLPILIVILIGTYILQFNGVLVITVLNTIYSYLLLLATTFSLAANVILGFFDVFAPLYNQIVRFLIQIIILIFNSICPGPFDINNIQNACPLITTYLNFLLIYWTLLLNILSLFFQLAQTIYLFIGNIICPNGVCSGAICSLSNSNPCNFNITVFMTWLTQIIDYVLKVLFQIARLTLSWVSDILNMIIFNVVQFGLSFGTIFTFLGGNTATLENVTPVSTDPQMLTALNNYKTLLLYTKDRIFELIGIYVRFFTAGFIMGDTIICNTIFDFLNCIASKMCYALAYAGLYIFEFIPLIKIPLDFRIICRFLGLFLEKCSCDVDIFVDKPTVLFGLDLYSFTYILIPFFVNSRIGCVQVQKGETRALCVNQPTTFTSIFSPAVNISAGVPYTTTLRPYVNSTITSLNSCNCKPGFYDTSTNTCLDPYPVVVKCICNGHFDYPLERFHIQIEGIGGLDVLCPQTALTSTYSVTPVDYFNVKGEGLWVPCVPGQNPCKKTKSILPYIFKNLG